MRPKHTKAGAFHAFYNYFPATILVGHGNDLVEVSVGEKFVPRKQPRRRRCRMTSLKWGCVESQHSAHPLSLIRDSPFRATCAKPLKRKCNQPSASVMILNLDRTETIAPVRVVSRRSTG